MKHAAIISTFMILFFVLLIDSVFAQNSEEELIKEAVTAESRAFFKRDVASWQSLWKQDSKSSRTFATSSGIFETIGWENFGPQIVTSLEENPEPTTIEVQTENFVITTNGDLAWVEYDQILTDQNDPNYKQVNRQQRALIKDEGRWKIRAQILLRTDTFNYSTPEGLEMSLNGLGYNLLAAEKKEEAIEVFKLNVKLFPDSWNVYDSLGEAYMSAGQNELAIDNYKKSIELNPDNEVGKEALTKLTGQ